MAGQHAKRQATEEARAERDRVRMVDQAERDKQRIRERSAAMAGRYYARQAAEERKANFVRERDEMRNRRRFASHIGGAAVGGFQSGAQRVGGLTMQAAGMVGQLGGGFSISDSVQRNAKYAGDVADLINAGINPQSQNKANLKRRDRGEVNGAIDTATIQYGMNRGDAIEGLREFTGKTGDFDTALKLLPRLAELSRATGTSLDKMAGAAGQAGLAFDDVADGGKKMEKIMQVMRTVAGQGKAGTVEIKDMATQMAKLVATGNKFEGDNVENLAKMGMLAQFAAGGGGAWSASSASTSVTSFGSVFSKGARLNAFKDKKIDVFTDKGETKLRAPEEIIADAFAKTGGKQSEVAKLFGSAMALRAVNKFGDAYSNGYTNQKGERLKGRDAVVGMAKDMTQTQMSAGEVTTSAKFRMEEIDAKMAVVQENFDRAVREKIIPALLDLVPEFERLVPQFVELNQKALPAFVDLFKTIAHLAESHKGLIDFFASNAIPTILGAALMQSIGSAALGEVMKVGIAKAFGDAGMGVAVSKALSSQIGQAGLVISTAALAIQQGTIAIDNAFADEDKAKRNVKNDEAHAAELAARLRRGTATDEDRRQASQLVTTLGADQSKLAAAQEGGSIHKLTGGLASFTEEGRAAQQQEQANNQKAMGELIQSQRELITALQANTTATKTSTGAAASGPNGAARSTGILQRNGIK